MLSALIRKELLSNLYNQRYVITLILLVTLLGISVWTLDRAQRIELDRFSEAQQQYEEDSLEAERVWHLMHAEFTRVKRPEPLARLVRGLDPDLTRPVTYAGWNEVEVGPPSLFSRLFRLYAVPDYVYILNVVGSLLALIFVYDAICGEKRQGTLRLMLTHPVPRDRVLLAKWLAGLLSLGVPLFLVTTAIGVALSFSSAVVWDTESLLRFGLLFLFSLLYLSAFFTLGLFISAVARHPVHSLMICLLCWVMLVLAMPNLMPMMARVVRPVPTLGKVEMEKRHKRQEVREWAQKALRPEIEDDDEYRETLNRLIARELQGIDQFRRNRVREQMVLARNLARLSPSAGYVFAATEIGRTGIGSFEQMQRYANWYRELLHLGRQRVEDKYRRQGSRDGRWWGWYALEAEDLQTIPDFRPKPVRFEQSLYEALPDAGLLALFNLIFFLGATVAFHRYDVT